MRNSSAAERLSHFRFLGHVLAWLLVLLPLSGAVLSVMLPGPEGVAQRIRTVAALIDNLLFPSVGLFLGMMMAAYFQQRIWSYLYAAVSALLGLTLIVLAPLFLLDFLQIRRSVEMLRLYDLNNARGLMELLLYGLLLLLLARATWRNLRADRALAATHAGVVRPAAERR